MTELWRRRAVDPAHDGWIALAARILRGSADLSGARCIEFPREFDVDRRATDLGFSDEDERWDHCKAVCRSCPVRGACWVWVTERGQNAISGPTAASVTNPFPSARRWERSS